MSLENGALKDLLEYEKKLIDDRRQLQNLLNQYQGESDEIIKDKLLFFQSELRHMNHQYELLKKKMQEEPCPVFEPVPNIVSNPVTEPANGEEVVQSDFAKEAVLPQTQWEFRPETELQSQKESPKVSAKESKSLEKMVGSSLMGILASGLIFISLILFATLILPSLGNAVKLFSCYAISFVLIGVSLLKLKKNEGNKFYTALAGCGVGALYITLLLTNIYFAYIGDITLFVLIIIWVAFVCYLSRVKDQIFHVIGQIGVTVSVIFGCILCESTDDFIKFISLTIFYVISFAALYVTHFQKEVARNKIGNIFGLINLSILFFTNSFINQEIYYLFVMLIALAHLIILFTGEWEETRMSYGIFVAFYGALVAYAIYACFSDYGEGCGIAIYIIAMAILLAVDLKEKKHREGQIFAQLVMVVQATMGLSYHHGLYNHGFVWLLVIPVILIGFIRKTAVLRYVGLVLTYSYLTSDISGMERFIIGLILIIALYVLMWIKKSEYSMGFKICLHLIGAVFLLTAAGAFLELMIENREISDVVQFMLLAIYNTALSKSIFAKDLKTGKKENMACYNIINMIMMIAGLSMIADHTPLHIPVILVTLVVFLQNSKNFLTAHKNIFAGIYVGLKFTILLVVILNSFDAADYVVSSLCILFAVASIILGFIKDYKSLRIYGLLLSMISVFKLVMVDIHYENTVGNAISFFISGVLCFAISLIYNYIDKKMAEDKESVQ